MASQVNRCSYGPDSESVSPLNRRQVTSLNTAGDYDVRARVARIVTKHLGYKGADEYSLKLNQKRVTFRCNGQTRILELRDNTWRLTINGDPAANPSSPHELTSDITDALVKINLLAGRNFAAAEDELPSRENAALRQQLHQLQSTVDQLRNQPPPQNQETLRLQQQASQQLADINSQISHLTESLTRDSTTHHALEERVKDLEASVNILLEMDPPEDPRLQEALDQMAEERKATAGQLEKMNATLQELKDNPPLNKSLETLQSTVGELQRNQETSLDKASPELLNQLTQNQQQMNQRLDDLNNAMSDLTNNKAKEKSRETEQMIQNLQNQVEQLKSQLNQPPVQSDSMQQKIVVNPAIVNGLATPIVEPSVIPQIEPLPLAQDDPSSKQLRERFVTTGAALNTASHSFNNILEITKLKKQLAEATKLQEESNKILDQQTQKMTVLTTQFTEAQNDTEKKQEMLNTNSEKINTLGKELSQHSANIEQLNKSLTEKSAQITELTAKIEESENQKSTEVAALNTQITNIEATAAEKDLSITQMKAELEKASLELQQLQTTLKQNQSAAKKTEQEFKTAQNTIASLEKALQEANDTIAKQSIKIGELTSDILKQNYELKQRAARLSSCEDAIQESAVENTSLWQNLNHFSQT